MVVIYLHFVHLCLYLLKHHVSLSSPFIYLPSDWGRTCERNTPDTWLILRPIMSLRCRPCGRNSTWEICLRKWRRPTRRWPRGECHSHAHKHSVNTSLTGPNLLICILNLLQPLFPRRCKQLDKALAEATFRIQELEGINGSLEKKLVTFSQTFFFDLRGIVTTSVKQWMCLICWCDCLESHLLTKLWV